MLSPGERVLVGFSGGADSTALLELLYELKDVLKISLCAVHLNHGIRQEAAEDAFFAKKFCESRGIVFELIQRDIPGMARDNGLTEEEAGRIARYEAFESCARKNGASKIAVAHHINDVAETLLMNLARGSGLHGAGAIKPVRGNIIRPLLCVSRKDIEDYLSEKEITFCTDRTNFENDHTRNVVRNVIIPELEKSVNAEAAEHLSRAAASFQKADEYILEQAGKAFKRCVTIKGDELEIDCNSLRSEAEIIRENIILLCFENLVRNRKDITRVHVGDVLKLIERHDGTASVDLPYNLIALRSYDRLEIKKREKEKIRHPHTELIIKPGDKKIIKIPGLGAVEAAVFPYDEDTIPPIDRYTKWFDYDKIQGVIFRTREAGDRLAIDIDGKVASKSLSKYMADEKIPPKERDNLYVLADSGNIIWVVGHRISAAYKVTESTRNILEINILNGGYLHG